jgi:uncharacterized coiled-coil DUF342 family protein
MTFDLEYYKSRINPAYQEVLGTESHERKMLCNEIERLRAENEKLAEEFVEYCLMIAEQDKKAHAEFKAEIDELQTDAERYKTLAAYLVSANINRDDDIVACNTVDELSAVLDSMKGQ